MNLQLEEFRDQQNPEIPAMTRESLLRSEVIPKVYLGLFGFSKALIKLGRYKSFRIIFNFNISKVDFVTRILLLR